MSSDNGRRSVVVGYDGSAYALEALDWALDEAEWRHLPLTLCNVWQWPYERTDERGRVALRTAAEHVLGHGVSCARERTSGVTVRSVLCEGSVAQRLVEVAADAEMLVVGTRGLGRPARWVVGSVAAQVAARAGCPVVVIRGGGPLPRPRSPRPVVVGVDATPAAQAVLGFAFREAELRRLPLWVVHACGEPGADWWSGLDMAAARKQLERTTTPWRVRHPDVGLRVSTVAASARTTLRNAAAVADLLVVGRAQGRPLLGSVGQWLLHHALCPVAIVPAPVRAGTYEADADTYGAGTYETAPRAGERSEQAS